MGQSTQHHRFRFATAAVSVSARGAAAPRTGACELHRQCFASVGQCAGAQIWPRLAGASCWISHRLRLGLGAVVCVAVVALARYGHPLRFYITPHCPQCPPVAAVCDLVFSAPPVQRPQTCSADLEAASGPAPRGAFCFGLLTSTCAIGPVKASQTPFVSKPHDFFRLGSEP